MVELSLIMRNLTHSEHYEQALWNASKKWSPRNSNNRLKQKKRSRQPILRWRQNHRANTYTRWADNESLHKFHAWKKYKFCIIYARSHFVASSRKFWWSCTRLLLTSKQQQTVSQMPSEEKNVAKDRYTRKRHENVDDNDADGRSKKQEPKAIWQRDWRKLNNVPVAKERAFLMGCVTNANRHLIDVWHCCHRNQLLSNMEILNE